MCDLQKSVPDVQAGPQSITQQPDPNTGLGGGTTNLGAPQKTVSTKFGSFLKYALPALQGAAYGVGSAQPVRGIGAGGFGASLAGALGRVGQHQHEMAMMNYQMQLEGMDRQLRLATLQNTIGNQQATQEWHRGNLEARLKSIEDANDKEQWSQPVAVDDPSDPAGVKKLLVQSEARSGKIRPVTLPGAQQDQGIAPTAPGGAGGGASPAPPNIQGNAPPGMFQGVMDIKPSQFDSGIPTRPQANAGIAPASALPGAAPQSTTAPGQLTKSKAAKHSRGETKLDDGIPTGIYGDNDQIYRADDPKIPDDLKASLTTTMNAHKQHVQEQKDIAASSRTAMQNAKPTTQFDTQLNITRTVPAGEAEANPGRYHVASYANIIDTQQKIATIKELDANLDRVDKLADNAKGPGLKPNVIAAGLADPESSLGRQFQSQMVKGLTPPQRDLIFAVRNLRQGAASYKNILSAGGVTDARIQLLERELPDETTIGTGDPKIIRQQLKSFRDIYQGVRDQYAPFFENMLGQKIGSTPAKAGAIPDNPYRKKATQPVAQAAP